MANILAGLMGASIGFGASSKIQQAKAQADIYDYNAQIQQQNATLARQNAKYLAERHTRQLKRLVSSQRAAYAASGVVGNTGTAADVVRSTLRQGIEDRDLILYRGELERINYHSQADLLSYQSRVTRASGTVNAISTLLSGVTSAYNTYQQGKYFGVYK